MPLVYYLTLTSLHVHLHMTNTLAGRNLCRWQFRSANHSLTWDSYSVKANLHQIGNQGLLRLNSFSLLKWKIIQIRRAANWPRSLLLFKGVIKVTQLVKLPTCVRVFFFRGRSEGLRDCRELIRSYSLTQSQMEQLSGRVSR